MKNLLIVLGILAIGVSANAQTSTVTGKENVDKVSFTLRNGSMSSIPLIIPGVMNPNLSPLSNSGVTLNIGQQILFRKKLKQHVLLVVDDSIEEGSVVEISKLYQKALSDLEK